MKHFESPELEILRFQASDIITVSNPDELPFLPAMISEDELAFAEVRKPD